MGRKNKYLKNVKIEVIKAYLDGSKSAAQISNDLNCDKTSLRVWVKKYKEYGEEIFKDKRDNKRYSKEFKEQVVKEYLEGKGSILDITTKYNILSTHTLRNWIYKYKNGIILSEYNPNSEVYTMKSRKVSYEERIEIVNNCISNGNDYKGTASKYNIPYSLVYTLVNKVRKNGYESLKLQKKGPKCKVLVNPKTTEEQLELEVEKLKRENECLKLENEVLKKKHRLQKRVNIQE